MNKSVTQEMIRFEREKSADLHRALKTYADIQIRSEKEKRGEIQGLLTEWKGK